MNRESLKINSSTRALAAILVLIAIAAGCGSQSYQTLSTVSQAQAAGTFTIPAKVDILLAEDDTGSMSQAYPVIAGQMPAFLTGLQNSGWDYHFATVPLTHTRPLTQVAASQYDSGWGSSWTPPFPGAQVGGPGMIASGFFILPQNYSGFLTQGDVQNTFGGIEDGFQSIWNNLNNGTITSSNFLRPDSLLVILVASGGNDTSAVKYCPSYQGSGYYVPCEQSTVPTQVHNCGTPGVSPANCYIPGFNPPGTQAAAVSAFANAFHNIPGHGSSPVQFYAAVSTQYNPNCQGSGSAYAGSQYMNMATAMNGQSYDICNGSAAVSSVLSQLSGELQAQRDSYKTRYIFIASAPTDLSKVVVTKNGAPLTQDPPNAPANGWTYVGMTTVYAIDYPVQMDQTTGYAIRLNGSAELVGSDTSSVTFQ